MRLSETCFRDLRQVWHNADMAPLKFTMKRSFQATFWLILAILCGFFFQAAQATEEAALTLQQNDRNWPITTIQINGQATSALLDTGATIALINDEHLSFDPMQVQTQPPTLVRGIGGQRLFPVTELSTLTAGTHSWQNVRVAINTEERFPVQQNILPISIFEASVVDFDFPNARVRVYEGHPKFVRDARRSALGYADVGGLIFIPIRINGVRGKALIDTGADVSFVNAAYAKRAKGVPTVDEDKDIRGSDLQRNTVQVYTFRRLQFGDNQISKFGIPVLETDLFRDLGFEEEPMMVLGMDVLRHFRLQVDLNRKRLTFLH